MWILDCGLRIAADRSEVRNLIQLRLSLSNRFNLFSDAFSVCSAGRKR